MGLRSLTPWRREARLGGDRGRAHPSGARLNRLQTLITRYGWIALALHYLIFFISLGAFAAAIEMGFDVEKGESQLDGWFATWLFSWLPLKWVGAYIATKVIQPGRIALTLVLTPWVARHLPQRKPPESVVDDPADIPFTSGPATEGEGGGDLPPEDAPDKAP